MDIEKRPRLGQVVEFNKIGSEFPPIDERVKGIVQVWSGFRNFWGRGWTVYPDGLAIVFPNDFTALSITQGVMRFGRVIPDLLSDKALSISNIGRNPLIVVERGEQDVTLAVLRTSQTYAARDSRNLTILGPARATETAMRMDTRGLSGDYIEFRVRASGEDYVDYIRRMRAGVNRDQLRRFAVNYQDR